MREVKVATKLVCLLRGGILSALEFIDVMVRSIFSTNPPSARRQLGLRGFTLMELLTVMVIIGMISAVSLTVFGNTGSKARKAARAELLGLLNRARAEAISTGKPVAVTFVGTGAGPDRLRGKAISMHSVRRNASTQQWEVVEQLQRWQYFPSVAVLLDQNSAPSDTTKGSNIFSQTARISVEVIDKEQNRKIQAAVPYLVFESSGSVVYPTGQAPFKFFIGEGSWHKSRFTLTAKTESGQPVADKIVVNRLSGRAREVSASNN